MTDRAIMLPVTAVIGTDGCLDSADEPLLRLQTEAGGQLGGPLALPALASLARLVLRLNVPLSRPVELAREGADISLWVKLRPVVQGVHLSIVDWQERNPRHGLMRSVATRPPVGWEEGPGWFWQIDEQMRFCRNEADAALLGHVAPQIGEAFLDYFVLEDGGSEGRPGLPIIDALAGHGNFADQAAHVRVMPAARYRISGEALLDDSGAFIGLRGRAARVDAEQMSHVQAMPPVPGPEAAVESRASDLFGPALGARLDRALRQPLDRIIANAGTIGDRLRGPLRHDYANYAGDIEAAGRHLLALVDDLADLQAIERSDFRPAGERVDLAELARRAAGLLHLRAETRAVRIQAPAAGEQVLARAEYRRVLQILVNLIGNAVRHSPSDSIIWVRVDEEDGRAKVVVADQGSGIDPADHERIFERFERLGNKDGEGSGLGLYISRMLARAMGGDVTLDSAPGRGARFTLDLPAWRAAGNDGTLG